MSHDKTANINSAFFDGYYKEIWRSIIPEFLTLAEVEYLIQEANLTSKSNVLDLMCGYGRHAITLARKGIAITALDNLADYISEIEAVARGENLPINCLLGDVLEFQPKEEYDLVICMGNNLSFFDEVETRKLFATISSCLRQRGCFIFNSWMIAEVALKHFKDKTWSYFGELKYLTDSKYFFSPSRIETETTIIYPNGINEVKNAVDYIYSINETEALLLASELRVKDKWSIPGKKKFSIGEPRLYVTAVKVE